MRLDTLRPVEAPEGVELALRVASPWPRALAWCIDALLITAIMWGMAIAAGLFGGVGQGALLIGYFLLSWGWDIVWEVSARGATPGKRALGLRVVSDDGTPVTWMRSFLRNLLRAADILPGVYAVGLCSSLTSADFKRLGDRVAGTLVVHRDPAPIPRGLPKTAPLAPPVTLAFEEQAALVEYGSRAREWTPARRAEIAAELESVTGAKGDEGVARVLGMALWVEGAR